MYSPLKKFIYNYALTSNKQKSYQNFLTHYSWVIIFKFGLNKIFHSFYWLIYFYSVYGEFIQAWRICQTVRQNEVYMSLWNKEKEETVRDFKRK